MAIYKTDGSQVRVAFDVNGQGITNAYGVDGIVVFSGTNYSSNTKTSLFSVSVSPMQGFDIYDGIIFQFLANSSTVSNKMMTINASTGAVITNNITASSDHGDSASFSNEFYSDGDTYPLLYVTSDTNPAKVYVNRVTTSSSTLVRTLSFPLAKTGYYAALCLDAENNIAYMVGYSEQNYQTDDGGNNKTVISKWDLSNLTENQDGSFTPAYISSVERAFIYVMQGQQFHDGLLWIASGGTGTSQYVYALDPKDGAQLFKIDLGTTTEVEGLSFTDKNKMVVGLQGGNYYLFTFPTA